MSIAVLAITLLALTFASFVLGRRRAESSAMGDSRALNSLPGYYGWYAALWAGLPGLACLVLWFFAGPWAIDELTLATAPDEIRHGDASRVALFLNDTKNLANGGITSTTTPEVAEAATAYARFRSAGLWLTFVAGAAFCMAGAAWAFRRISPQLSARSKVEQAVGVFLMVCSTIAILVTVGIVLSLIFETYRFFQLVSLSEFLFGLQWSPQTALRSDQVASSGSFGAVPVFAGTLLITSIAIVVAAPIGLFSAIYMTFYAGQRVRTVVKPVLEILAGVPTVVYGFFAALVIAPLIRDVGTHLGMDVASESALAAGLVMGVMIIPFISSLSDDAITAVPTSLRDGSYGLGATRSETIRLVILPAALPGIVGAFLLAISRAVGETMIVVMAAGLAANLTGNPLQAVTTVTVQIVTLLTGDQEFDSAKTLAAFALGLALFGITLCLNIFALRMVQKYREQYD